MMGVAGATAAVGSSLILPSVAQAAGLKGQRDVNIRNLYPNASSSDNFWNAPRTLYLERLGESARIVYYNDHSINRDGYQIACYLLRDAEAGKMIDMDLKLLDLLCAMQAWLIHFNYEGPIIINSGYRTRGTNNKYSKATTSMHLYGKAADCAIPGMTSSNLAQISAQFRAGGIGVYPSRNFVHVDTGNIRSWIQ